MCYRWEGGGGRPILFVLLPVHLWEAPNKMHVLSVGVILFKATFIYNKFKVELMMTN